ncbi:threonine/homoserine/homoserine lactone efflux protein [Rubricella aquisinus]|uniref:Threonine/homoserine/homoserine lactone efflux protein n=1 Tax=Rubricella aquisinus TaxID=2028108 RepID=A0A840WKT2_9RHOB|nr:LysE family translocator [Rubricella aquisinus]MBB5514272.1 threonine/homoserine/homoserine lactone efflux protein [Rubricella aquisinus]
MKDPPMIDPAALLIFVPIALALNLTPGADMLFCLGQGVRSGPSAGRAAAWGVAVGALIHTFAAGLGFAAFIAAHPVLFEVIRWAGVGYLVWLALQGLRYPITTLEPTQVGRASVWGAFRRGVVVNVLNPKIALFFLALIPQFVEPDRGPILLQFLIFGLILNVGGTSINLVVGSLGGGFARLLARNTGAARALQYGTSALFVMLAARLALQPR